MVIAKALKDVFVVGAKRTPFGSYGGKLMKYSATDLEEISMRSALESANINPEIVNSVHVGNVNQTSADGIYLARHAALRVGVPIPVPALTSNRLCGSGFQAIISGAQDILLGDSEVSLTGGTENMSMAPHVLRGARFGIPLGQDMVLEDTLWKSLTDLQAKCAMGMTAENLAEQYNITREDADAYALKSQQRWKAAEDAGLFKEEMASIKLKTKKGVEEMTTDEHPRPSVTAENLAKLPPVFKKEGTVTAGNASGICDGAGSIILASGDACAKHGLKPLVRLAGYGIAGVEPTRMGIGPVPAIDSVLKINGKTLNDIDLVEVNEAFASQYLAVEKELGLDPAKTNVNGGAIALGHPVGASGARIITHLVYELRRRGGKYALGSACIGGGQGIALLLENVN